MTLTLGACDSASSGDAATPPPGTPTLRATITSTKESPSMRQRPTVATQPRTSRPRRAPAPVVVLDAGHNGANAANPDVITQQVPAGRGRVKDCNTTGTSTDSGYPEHAFNFDVAQRVDRLLEARGVRVRHTRESDDGIGPCVHERAAIANEAGAAAVVSIHADGASSSSARGFHIAYSAPPLNAAQGEPTLRLAETMLLAMSSAGFPVAGYIGHGGLSPRDDLAGMNLSTRPAVLVECGNMRNPAEAAAMETPDGRQRYADAIARGILTYLAR